MTLYDNLFLFFPILIITLFVLYPDESIIASHTLLGKMVIVLFIIFYTFKDAIYGILVTLLTILYYQTEIYETMIDRTNSELLVDNSSFKESHCKDGHLTFKNMVVKPEMAEHIFPNIQFKGDRCNVCDSTCGFTILNQPEQILSYRQEFGK